MSILTDLIPVNTIIRTSKEDQGQIGECSILLQGIKLEALDYDWHLIFTISNSAKVVGFQDLVHSNSDVLSMNNLLSIVVLELDIESHLSVTIHNSRRICIKHPDLIDYFLQSQHFKLAIHLLVSIVVALFSLEKLEFGKREVVDVKFAIRSFLASEAFGILIDVCGGTKVDVMLSN